MRIGVINLSTPGWSAGASFSRMLGYALRSASVGRNVSTEWIGAAPGPDFEGMPVHEIRPSAGIREKLVRHVESRLADSRVFEATLPLRESLHLVDATHPVHAAALAGLDVILPVMGSAIRLPRVATIGWIPDFQHVHLPQYFSATERSNRDTNQATLSDRCDRILLSSQAARSDFDSVLPLERNKARVLPFPSKFAFEMPTTRAESVRTKYHLVEPFLLVANQFWMHKNHTAVIEALAIAARNGLAIHAVFTGRPADYRDPRNGTVSEILQMIAARGLSNRVVVLGEVPDDDLTGLLRAASLVVQPSRFEGWSTTVQDAKALARPLICSDIPVHREQAPGAVGYFDCDSPEALARLLGERWNLLVDQAFDEDSSLRAERDFGHRYGERLLALCEEAVRTRGRRRRH